MMLIENKSALPFLISKEVNVRLDEGKLHTGILTCLDFDNDDYQVDELKFNKAQVTTIVTLDEGIFIHAYTQI